MIGKSLSTLVLGAGLIAASAQASDTLTLKGRAKIHGKSVKVELNTTRWGLSSQDTIKFGSREHRILSVSGDRYSGMFEKSINASVVERSDVMLFTGEAFKEILQDLEALKEEMTLENADEVTRESCAASNTFVLQTTETKDSLKSVGACLTLE
jgi:hypothetical protein